ncbi:MAG: TlyA family RNA methyltransferase [Oscillospiraceae bacterium]|nr:TlyA family RNA methyltransferase [Oscillospiraceae bacterium]
MKRLDVLLFESGKAQSRNVAKKLICSGSVAVDGRICTKPSAVFGSDSLVEIVGDMPKYVGRGGYKLEKALSQFNIKLDGCVCADIGASTGGFTDCMLQNGAEYVYAIDVGKDQLAKALRNNEKVKSLEQTDIRSLDADDFQRIVSFAACDVSFISIGHILVHMRRLLSDDAQAVVLIKPQFEAGRSNIGKNGVVKDKKVHCEVLQKCIKLANDADFDVLNICASPIKGSNGNVEYLMHLKCRFSSEVIFEYKNIVNQAFDETKTEEFF